MIKIKRLLKIFLVIVGICVLIIFLIRVYLSKNYLNKVFWVRDYGIFVEHSSLMEPDVHKDELVVIKIEKKYDLDDVIAYINFNNNLVVRRIVQIDEYGFVARADKSKFPEPDEKIENICGKVIYHSKILGWILRW